MKILILGSGIIGVTTAYFLSKRGHDVTVIDREPECAMECSFANGGQLSYCHAEPWASPSALVKAAKWLGKKDAPLLFSFRADLQQWLWTFKFLRNCTSGRVKRNSENMLRLGLYSRKVMHEIQQDIDFDFHYCQKGILHTFNKKSDLDHEIKQSEFQKTFGAPFEVLTPEQCIEKEPALSNIKENLVGGVFYELDESADIHEFTEKLAEKDKTIGSGVKFLYDTNVEELKTDGKKITGVKTDKGEFEADIYVMALGAYSPVFLRPIGINVPIYPMKGYSISINTKGYDGAPELSLTDQAHKLVFSRLGDILRVAGTAEFAGYNHDVNPVRIEMMKQVVRDKFPNCGDIENAAEWACLRPSTPEGCPTLGKIKYDNLVLNTGHGTLGWTQGAGSAKIVADIIEGKEPEIDMKGLNAKRYE